MARPLCERCHYPISHCVCSAVTHVEHETKLIILQVGSERKNAKNTARLLTLCSGNINIINGKSSNDFVEQLDDLDLSTTAVLFPSEEATPLERGADNYQRFNTVLVIDASWRHAKKLYLTSPWLQQLPHLSFGDSFEQQYGIRKTSVENGLSTLEASAYCLEYVDNISSEPFFKLLNHFKAQFLKNMPEGVKARYQK